MFLLHNDQCGFQSLWVTQSDFPQGSEDQTPGWSAGIRGLLTSMHFVPGSSAVITIVFPI